jgi:lipopolysaccharide transport system ATP-binding protein
MRFLRRFRETGTILFVSHDTAAVVNLCNSAIWLDRGAVRQIGPAKETCEAYLASYYEAQQGPHAAHLYASRPAKRPPSALVDQRQKYLNHSQYRNDLRLMEFDDSGAAFGKGRGRVTAAQFLDEQGAALSWVVGGETVTLRIEAQADESIGQPIIGFLVKDRLGQVLFSDNTCLTHASQPMPLEPGQSLEARFTFQMPILPTGDYSVAISLAEGTQAEHIQHHWIHDAIVFKSITSSVCTGLVGIPMLDITMDRKDCDV